MAYLAVLLLSTFGTLVASDLRTHSKGAVRRVVGAHGELGVDPTVGTLAASSKGGVRRMVWGEAHGELGVDGQHAKVENTLHRRAAGIPKQKIEETISKPLTAFCVAGDVRTFPQVAHTLKAPLRGTDAVGIRQTDGPDLFLHLSLKDDPNIPKMYDAGTGSIQTHSESEVKSLVEVLKPVHASYAASVGEATSVNVDTRYVSEDSRDCFNEKGWAEANNTKRLEFNTFWHYRTNMARSMNQLEHIKDCLREIKKYEESNGKQYSVVAVGRPDLQYGKMQRSMFAQVAAENGTDISVGFQDFFLVFRREKMDNFFSRTGPLRCRPGEQCCGRVTRSEDLYSFILGTENPCDCANEKVRRPTQGVDVCLRRPDNRYSVPFCPELHPAMAGGDATSNER